MKKFIKEYIRVIAFSIIGLIFGFASFYLMINYNHNEEVKKGIYIGENEVNYGRHIELLNQLNDNISKINNKKSNSLFYNQITNSLNNCYNVLRSYNSFSSIQTNKEYKAYEIYKIGTYFQNDVLNVCWNNGFNFLINSTNSETNIIVPESYKSLSLIVDNYVKSINTNLTDSLREIENNSSYFYSTSISSLTVRNYLGSDYITIANSYNDFTSILIDLSLIVNNNEVKTNG